MFKYLNYPTIRHLYKSNQILYQKRVKTGTETQFNFYPLLQTWNTSPVPVSLNIIKNNLYKDGWNCNSKKIVGFYGITKEDAIQYLRNSYPRLNELPILTKNINHHVTLERFSDVYINQVGNRVVVHLWEYYPGTEFLQDELNGYSLTIIPCQK